MGNTVCIDSSVPKPTTPPPINEAEQVRCILGDTQFIRRFTHHMFGSTLPTRNLEPVHCHVRSFLPEETTLKTCVWNITPKQLLTGIRAINFLGISNVYIEYPHDQEITSIHVGKTKYHNILLPRPTIEGNTACVILPIYMHPHHIMDQHLDKAFEMNIGFANNVDMVSYKCAFRYFQSATNNPPKHIFTSHMRYQFAYDMIKDDNGFVHNDAMMPKNCYAYLNSIAICVPIQETPIICTSIALYAQHKNIIPLVEVSGAFARNIYQKDESTWKYIDANKYQVYVVELALESKDSNNLVDPGAINQSRNEIEHIPWSVGVRATFESAISTPPILISNGVVYVNACW
jgi:hypothetical protein